MDVINTMTRSNLGRKGIELSSVPEGRQGRNLRQDGGMEAEVAEECCLLLAPPGLFLHTTRLLANGWHCLPGLGPSMSINNQ